MFQEAQNIELTTFKNRLLYIGAGFCPHTKKGQYKLLVQCSKLEVLLLILQNVTDFLNEINHFFSDSSFGDALHKIADVSFTDFEEIIWIDMAKICNIFLIELQLIYHKKYICPEFSYLRILAKLQYFFRYYKIFWDVVLFQWDLSLLDEFT